MDEQHKQETHAAGTRIFVAFLEQSLPEVLSVCAVSRSVMLRGRTLPMDGIEQ
jgi:hypothetical protein